MKICVSAPDSHGKREPFLMASKRTPCPRGSGTTCLVAAKLNRDWIGIDLCENYCKMARERGSSLGNETQPIHETTPFLFLILCTCVSVCMPVSVCDIVR